MVGALIGYTNLDQEDNIEVLLGCDTSLGPTSRPREYSPSDFNELMEKVEKFVEHNM